MLNNFEVRHRERKRNLEMEIIIKRITPFIGNKNRLKILEFGSGDGYQIPHLKQLGSVIASDIYPVRDIKDTQSKSEISNGVYKSDEINRYPDTGFVFCDIRNAPFALSSFGLVFSNHVLEHIREIKLAFAELKRIGRSDCIYAFTVPTNIWLLLSIPAQCYNMLRRILNKEPKNKASRRQRETDVEIRGWRRFLPVGHGWQKNFLHCFNSFRIKNWQKLFTENGFTIVERVPLLLYAPSEFPIVPTSKFLVKQGICSSVMFILKKAT